MGNHQNSTFLYCFQSNKNFSFMKINLAGSLRFDWRFLENFYLLRVCLNMALIMLRNSVCFLLGSVCCSLDPFALKIVEDPEELLFI